jgi:cytochrome bd ubiquinol oxidase subunit II
MDILSTQFHWLPFAFAGLMGLSILLYVMLDGYDLGVGILLMDATDPEKDKMIASIGPFWDANETWLVMGVGLLLVAFPMAHGAILTALYLPTATMLIALILRGVSFDFRAKVHVKRKQLWDHAFFAGSLGAALSQGYMLGFYIMSFENTWVSHLFSILVGVCLAAGYSFIGAAWLIMKTEDNLQRKAVRWARISLWLTALGIGVVSLATPLVNANIFAKWFSVPNIFLLSPVPAVTAVIILYTDYILKQLPTIDDQNAWRPFAAAVALFVISFAGLAYSFYPFIVPQKMTIYGAAAAPESLMIILWGAIFVLPCILGYTIYAYRVFWGKVRNLSYY